MCKINLNDLLLTKILLINDDSTKIISSISDSDNFKTKLDVLDWLLDNEESLFLLSDYSSFNITNNVLDLINEYRFLYRDKDILNQCNNILGKINCIKALPIEEKESLIEKYVIEQEMVRNILFDDNVDELLLSMVLDASFYFGQIKGYLDGDFKNCVLLLGSINYFLNCYPELFTNDEFLDYINYSLSFVIDNNTKFSKVGKYAKTLKKEINVSR